MRCGDLGVSESLGGGGVRLVHARTDRESNVAVHHEIEAAVAAEAVSGPTGTDRSGR